MPAAAAWILCAAFASAGIAATWGAIADASWLLGSRNALTAAGCPRRAARIIYGLAGILMMVSAATIFIIYDL